MTADKVLVDTIHLNKLLVGAALFYLTMLHADDFVGILDCAESVRDDDDSLLSALNQLVQGLLDLMLALSI